MARKASEEPAAGAKESARSRKRANKEPGRIKQMHQVYKMTVRYDPTSRWIMLLAFLLPVVVGVLVAVLLSLDSWLGMTLWILAGVLGGLLAFLIVLGRRAERAAFAQIAGQPGAVGAVLKSALPRSWIGSEMPVAISPRTQDAVYRAVGRAGVVLIGEGPQSRTKRMLDDEKRKVAKILPNVPVHFIHVGPDPDSIELHRIRPTVKKYKKALNKAEVYAVNNRVTSLSKATPLPIPKGIDPMKARAPRPR